MRKGTKKLKKFEQFEPEIVEVEIDKGKLRELISMATPLLDEISKMIEQEDDRTISIEYYQRVLSAIDVLDELKNIY